MSYYMLRIKCGKDGDDNPEKIRQFIDSSQLIGIGAPDETRGSVRFEQLKKGEFVVVLSQSMPVAFVEILDDQIDPYTHDNEFPGFDWLECVRKVKIVSWYEDDKDRLSLPSFSPTSWGPGTFKQVDGNEHLIKQWHEVIMNELYKKQHEALVSEVRDLVLREQNVILTGAPGTGKTHLAHEVARAIIGSDADEKKCIGFCQFHPSFDYTDFVEGLRPIKQGDNIQFKRQDGIFKKFCHDADSGNIDNFTEAWDAFAKELDEKQILAIPQPSGGQFNIEWNKTGKAQKTQGGLVCNDGSSPRYFNKNQLYNVYRGKPGVPKEGLDSYRKAIITILQSNFGLKPFSAQPYVFIIDEINRGDISKIFGELFFAIDPGYRGKNGQIKTQYHNLVTKEDSFPDGFYVPGNVYIIGTMNDIDRNVESMDFAIRRRFTWKKILAENTCYMWAEIDDFPTDDAISRLKNLNKSISSPESPLNENYHIGPSYFNRIVEYDNNWESLWELHIRPLLEEYLRGLPDTTQQEWIAKFKTAFDLN